MTCRRTAGGRTARRLRARQSAAPLPGAAPSSPLDLPPDEETREHARILRRVSVRTWHFRGIGAHGVPTAAAEQGRRLDHGYPADPDGTLHLCRLDDHTRPA
ncbi:hypothetical protein [Streptomyces noursei]|nr:hypothetical protein [Streptomyces noursei]UWS76248.1 hypothetical protein N1H47_36395 [Streptomyces noursei]